MELVLLAGEVYAPPEVTEPPIEPPADQEPAQDAPTEGEVTA